MGFPAIARIGRRSAAAGLALLASCGGGGGGPGPGPGPQPRYDMRIVTTLAGSPVPGATVLTGLDLATSGADGSATFPQLTAGNYIVSVQAPGGEFGCDSVSLNAGTTEFTISLTPGAGFNVVSLQPAMGAVSATADPEIILTLSMDIDPESVEDLSLSFTPAIGSLNVTESGGVLALRANRQLPLGQLIVCQLGAGLKAVGGTPLALPVRFAFRTPGADNAPPRLLSSRPVDGEPAFPPNLAVRLDFNEPLGSLDTLFSATALPAAVLSVTPGGSSLIVSAEGGWAPDTAYSLNLNGIPDSAGNRIDVALGFTASSTPAPSSNIQPEWNRVRNEIVFASDAFGSYDIFSIAPDGNALTPLSGGAGDELHPTLSSDGLLIAWQARGPGGDWDVFTAPRDEPGAAGAITGGPANDTEPAFSRTFSRSIFFTSDRSNPQGLYSMGEDGSNPGALDFDFNSTSSQAAPHPLLDTQLLFVSAREGSTDVWRKTISVVDSSTLNLNLTSDINTVDRSPAWAPDASFIVYVSDRSGSDDLWLADPSGAAPRRVTTLTGAIADPSVSPFVGSTECVAALANGLGGSDIVIIDLVGGTVLRNLTGTGDGS